ncbi:hypothetical protein WJX73_010054 [Symbiochloris irregularis]|uniref:Uncharacterized protein n=1 Tax=Symbiochloris irregularis TaxID=706552 RepID=A0AAW1NMM1_9CHLO
MTGYLTGLVPVALLYITVRWSLAARLLAGLTLWDVPQTDKEQENSPSKSPAKSRTSKHGSVAMRTAKQVNRFPGASSLTMFVTTKGVVEQHEVFESVNMLVISWVILAGTAGFEVLRAYLAGAAVSSLPAWLALAAVVVALYSLAEVDVVSKVVPAVERCTAAPVSRAGQR